MYFLPMRVDSKVLHLTLQCPSWPAAVALVRLTLQAAKLGTKAFLKRCHV